MQLIRKRSLALLLAATLPFPAMARDVIGADEEEEEEVKPPPKKAAPADKAPPPAAKQPPAADKADKATKAPPPKDGAARPADKAPPPAEAKKTAPAAREKTEDQIEKEREAAEEAALKKAEEDARRKREEEARKKSDQDSARKAKKEEVGKGNLEAARAERTYKRQSKDSLLTLKLRPGAVDANLLLEMVVDARVILAEPDPTYGDQAPMDDAVLFATFTNTLAPPPKDPKAKPAALAPTVTYAIHPLGDAGSYGFHASLPSSGAWTVKLHGTRKDGKPVSETIPLHAAVWPPPDFEQEEKKNAELGGGGGRRALED